MLAIWDNCFFKEDGFAVSKLATCPAPHDRLLLGFWILKIMLIYNYYKFYVSCIPIDFWILILMFKFNRMFYTMLFWFRKFYEYSSVICSPWLLLLMQGMRILPTGRKSSLALVLYGSIVSVPFLFCSVSVYLALWLMGFPLATNTLDWSGSDSVLAQFITN